MSQQSSEGMYDDAGNQIIQGKGERKPKRPVVVEEEDGTTNEAQPTEALQELIKQVGVENAMNAIKNYGRSMTDYTVFNQRPMIIDLSQELSKEQKALSSFQYIDFTGAYLFKRDVLKPTFASKQFTVKEGFSEFFGVYYKKFKEPDGEMVPDPAQATANLRKVYLCLVAFSHSKNCTCSLVMRPQNIIDFVSAFVFQSHMKVFKGNAILAQRYLESFDVDASLTFFKMNAHFLKKNPGDDYFDGKLLAVFSISQRVVDKYAELAKSSTNNTERLWLQEIHQMFSTSSFSAFDFEEISNALVDL